jgi:hypothetical protein
MTKKATTGATVSNAQVTVEQPQKNIQPLVFISHDTRDADLAEEFSNLLRNSSAGALKSFRSSDKKGTQGIEYGLEWYPAIMDKIDEASDVVCLLTQNSVDRPWILYEAGVAKGKLNMKVIGIALGIPLTEAVKGPFAQFQNNDGDIDSITKLVYDLVKKVPGLDPDKEVVKTLVQTFLNKVSEMIIKKAEVKTEKESKDDEDDNSVVKLFEEVKIMFQDLPQRIDRRWERGERSMRRHPKYFISLLHSEEFQLDNLNGFLIVLGYIRNDAPWIYEVGMETYRALSRNSSEETVLNAIDRFSQICKLSTSHPVLHDILLRDRDDLIYILEELRFFVNRHLEMGFNRQLAKSKIITKNSNKI